MSVDDCCYNAAMLKVMFPQGGNKVLILYLNSGSVTEVTCEPFLSDSSFPAELEEQSSKLKLKP